MKPIWKPSTSSTFLKKNRARHRLTQVIHDPKAAEKKNTRTHHCMPIYLHFVLDLAMLSILHIRIVKVASNHMYSVDYQIHLVILRKHAPRMDTPQNTHRMNGRITIGSLKHPKKHFIHFVHFTHFIPHAFIMGIVGKKPYNQIKTNYPLVISHSWS